MRFKNVPKMSEFDKWLFEEPWRLERYYGMVTDIGDLEEYKRKLNEEYKKLSDIFRV